jgi:hypothetical protein
MTRLDRRTRKRAAVRRIVASEFFGDELRELAAHNGHLVVEAMQELGAEPLVVEVEGRSWSVHADAGRLVVETGAAAGAFTVALAPDRFSDWAQDVSSLNGLVLAGTATTRNGSAREVGLWDSLWRCLLEGWPVVGAIEFRDRRGEPLDLGRVFSPDDDPDELAHHLREAGFARLRGWVSPEEAAAIGREMDEALPHYTEGDGRSWWARTSGGDNRRVRMQCFHEASEATAALLADERLQRLGSLFDDGHRLGKPGPNKNIVEALFKPIGVVQGISDVPWHKDCSLGSHSYRCCSLTVGISVTGADAESGQLGVVAGSHRALIQSAFVRKGLDLPQVELPTQTGDVTVHLSCTLHMAHPPITRERRVLYTDFSLPTGDGPRSPGEATLARIREGASRTISQPPSPVQG